MARRRGGRNDGEPAEGGAPIRTFVIEPDGTHSPAGPVHAPRGPASPRRWSVLAVCGALVLVLGAVVVTHQRSTVAGTPSLPITALPTSTTTVPDAPPLATSVPPSQTWAPNWGGPPITPSVAPASPLPPWPTAAGACDAEQDLPLLSGLGRVSGRTGVQVVTGSVPQTVDVDDHSMTPLPISLAATEYVSDLASDADGTVAVVGSCDTNAPTRVVRVHTGHTAAHPTADTLALAVGPPQYLVGGLISGGDQVWLAQYAVDDHNEIIENAPMALFATDGTGTRVTLPKNFEPFAGYRDKIIGDIWDPDDTDPSAGPIEVYSLTTHRVVDSFGGKDVTYSVGNGYVVWANATCGGGCPVHVRNLSNGTTRVVNTTLTTTRSVGFGTISPDGRLLAVHTYDNTPDPRYATDHPIGPGGVAVMDLTSGVMTDVPGVELAPKGAVEFSFAGDGQWLVMALGLGDHTKILLWRPDLAAPLDAGVTLTGPTAWTTPLALVSG